MQTKLHPKIAIPLAIIALLVSYSIYYFLLTPVPEQQQLGTIQKVEFFGKERVERTTLHGSRNMDSGVKKTAYTRQERYVYTIKLKDGKTTHFSRNRAHYKSKPEYEVGQELQITYTLREIPFSEDKISVIEADNLN